VIDIDQLRTKQAEFEGARQAFKKDLVRLETERQNFIKRFPIGKIKQMSLDEYVVGSKSGNSFCYLIENRLQGLGNIHGATAFKFGIYFGKTQSDPKMRYRFTSKFGKTEDVAFQNVKSAILQLLETVKKDDLDGIRNNPLSPMFKGKILSTYFPDKYLNIFADEHLEYFLDKLEIPYSEFDDEIAKRKMLIEFKQNDSVMAQWTIFEFSKFLYESFGRPSRKEDAPKELKDYLESKKDYPRLNDVQAEFINLDIIPENVQWGQKSGAHKPKVTDFEKENKNNKLLGNRGEELVFNLERKWLLDLKRRDLAGKVEWVSKKDDSLGYDIKSFEENGAEKFIEVKSTSQSPDSNANFLISSNQYSKAKDIKNYYFYIVFNAKSKKPRIWRIKNPIQYENNGLTLIPISYRVIINTKI